MTAVRLMYFLGALVVGVAWVPALSFLDTHGSADLLWAIGLFALGEILVAISRARRHRLRPTERRPIVGPKLNLVFVALLALLGGAMVGLAFTPHAGPVYLVYAAIFFGLAGFGLLSRSVKRKLWRASEHGAQPTGDGVGDR